MTGGTNSNAIIMRRPDGTPMTREEVIIQRRGAFKWLPVMCSNDLVHGSWWFTIGSFFTTVFAIYPLVQNDIGLYEQQDDFLPATDFDVTWGLLIVSGVFFTLGSLAFVRAFEEPPRQPLFYWYKHFQTDELLGAWLFLFGMIPAIPYMVVFFVLKPSAFYFIALVLAIIFVFVSWLFVVACYPSDKKMENYVLPFVLLTCGNQIWMLKHLANDWLAGTWFFLWANGIATLGSGILLIAALAVADPAQIFIWLSGFVSAFLFLVGSFYFVSGSYPHASQFYYDAKAGGGRRDQQALEVYQDELESGPPTLTNALTKTFGAMAIGSTTTSPFHSSINQDFSLAPSTRSSVHIHCPLPTHDPAHHELVPGNDIRNLGLEPSKGSTASTAGYEKLAENVVSPIHEQQQQQQQQQHPHHHHHGGAHDEAHLPIQNNKPTFARPQKVVMESKGTKKKVKKKSITIPAHPAAGTTSPNMKIAAVLQSDDENQADDDDDAQDDETVGSGSLPPPLPPQAKAPAPQPQPQKAPPVPVREAPPASAQQYEKLATAESDFSTPTKKKSPAKSTGNAGSVQKVFPPVAAPPQQPAKAKSPVEDLLELDEESLL